MNEQFIVRYMLQWNVLTPWFLYGVATVFGATCVWEKGRNARLTICIVIFFFGTVIMVMLIVPRSYESLTEMMKATYYFPQGVR